jgi:hypothetical protein
MRRAFVNAQTEPRPRGSGWSSNRFGPSTTAYLRARLCFGSIAGSLGLFFVCAAALPAQPDSTTIITRVLSRVRETTHGLPRYACLETVTRDYYAAVAPVMRSCELVLAGREHPTPDLALRHTSTDRLRLEVAMGRNGELHSWAGDREFLDGNIDQLVREGPLGSGMFSGFLASIFEQDVTGFRFLRLTPTLDRHSAAQFAFDVPVDKSHYKIKVGTDWQATAYTGSFEADAADGELAWLEIKTAVLPPAAGTCQTTTRLKLGRTAIGAGRFLVTTRAQQEFEIADGGRVVNTIDFSGCREYLGESSIHFETDGALHSGTSAEQKSAVEDIPPGLPFTLELRDALDTATAAAGDRFTARLASSIRNYQGHTFAPRGALVQGRLLRVQTFYGTPKESIFVLRPESVEVRGVKIPLTAVGDRNYVGAQQQPVSGKKKGAVIYLPYQSETHATLLRFPGDHAIVKRGYVSHWVTVLR